MGSQKSSLRWVKQRASNEGKINSVYHEVKECARKTEERHTFLCPHIRTWILRKPDWIRYEQILDRTHPEIKKLQDWEPVRSQGQHEVFDSAQDLLGWGEKGYHGSFCGELQGSKVGKRGYRLDQRVIECETRHREGSEILHSFQDGARCVLNGLEVDLGAIILAMLPKFVAEDTTNPGLGGFDCLDRIMAAE
ncbi:hypothetical protein EDD85DRAFT_232544 [Armillaria nabsnona]|nr:hypothetical protein EDD85DRAFT_232544 [Armillaria nabsnona]